MAALTKAARLADSISAPSRAIEQIAEAGQRMANLERSLAIPRISTDLVLLQERMQRQHLALTDAMAPFRDHVGDILRKQEMLAESIRRSVESISQPARGIAHIVESMTARLREFDAIGEKLSQFDFQAQQRDFAALLAFKIPTLQPEPFCTILGTDIPDAEDEQLDALPEEQRSRIVRADGLPLSLVRAILASPADLHALTPRQFESLIAEVVGKLGFSEVILTPRTGDGGKDVVASTLVAGIPFTVYFECKKYAAGNKVEVGLVRSLLGVVASRASQADKGVLVTTSTFTKGAWEMILGESRLDGRDYDGVLGWIHDIYGKPGARRP